MRQLKKRKRRIWKGSETMKLFIVSILLFFANSSFSQWKNEIVKNGFDDPFKIATTPLNNKCYLKMEDIGAIDEERFASDSINIPSDTVIKIKYSPEHPDGISDTSIHKGYKKYVYSWRKVYGLSLNLEGSYFCDDEPQVIVVLSVGGVDKKYTFKGSTHNNRKGVQIKRNIMDDPQFILDFEKASYISIRVNDTECETEVFRYKMTGSQSAIQFMKRLD